MSGAARVEAIKALRTLREALLVFGVAGQSALEGANLEVRRSFDGLQARLDYWRREARKREEEVARARSELAQRRWAPSSDQRLSTVDQEIALRKAQQRLQEAEARIETVRRWQQQLPRAVNEFEGPARQLAGWLDADLRQAVALLDRRIDALQAYVDLLPPSGGAAAPPS